MKFITAVSLSLFILIAVPFVAGDISSASGQVVTKTKRTTKKVGRKTWRGTKRVGHTARVKSKPARKKTWRTGRKVVSRTKKIFS
jgi:hypothetical protein